MRHYIGIDIGSSATKLAAVNEERRLQGYIVIPLGAGTKADRSALAAFYQESGLDPGACVRTIATGYGRLIFDGADGQVSEITCHAKGIHHVLPQARTVIDVGGQDLKVIQLSERGTVQQFVMNDKCAAGTGRFLEVMSRVMGLEVSALEEYDAQAVQMEAISSTCTVFAESEVISKLSAGSGIPDIVAGIHDSVARRVMGLTLRIGLCPEVALTGGGALNRGLVRALERHLKCKLLVPEIPQITGALGAALFALEGRS